MDAKQTAGAKLIDLLSGIEFARRYYDFEKTSRERAGNWGMGRKDFEAALAATSLSFVYEAKERFFKHEQAHEHCAISLGVAFSASTIEMILYVKTKHGYIGGPFPLLARQVAQLRDPNFVYAPPFPKLTFSNVDGLHRAIQFGVSLFRDAKRSILSYTGWDC